MNKKSVWTDVLVIGSIVAVGVVVAGLTNDPMEPSPQGYVGEPVDYPVDIPGCDFVEPPEDDVFYGYATSGTEGYDNPDYPWLTSSKANAMSLAIQASVPEDVEIVTGSRGPSHSEPFVFRPVPSTSPEFDPGTSADATVTRNGLSGSLSVNVTRSDEWPMPCRAGWLDSRETLTDGTVVDLQDTWSEYDGERSYTNLVRVHATDGTRIVASSSDQDDEFRFTGTIPVTIDELRDMALRPELRWSTPVPGDVLPVPIPCWTGESGEGQFTADVVERVNSSLNDVWRSIGQPAALDRPLGSLRATSGTAGACGSVLAGGDTLTVTVMDAAYAAPDFPMGTVTLPDGSQFRDEPGSGSATVGGKPIEGVLLVKPSGTRIEVRIASATDRVDRATMQALALAAAAVVD